jgi:MFS family permease
MKSMLALLCTAQFMVVLDVTIVAIALPQVRGDLGFTTAGLAWVVTAYTLSFGCLLIVAGRAGDLFGHRRLFAAGLGIFGVASLICGLAWSPAVLVGARVIQGVGAAIVAPTALALLNSAFPAGPQRRRALSWWTASAAGGGACGWLLGGVLTESLGWRSVFLVNVPVALVAALATRLLTETPRNAQGSLDLPGAATLTIALAALLYGSWGFAAAVVALAWFVRIERRTATPMLPLSALRERKLSVPVLVAAVLTATTTPVMFIAVLYQQQTLGAGALITGLATAPFNLAVIAGAALGARLGPRAAMVGGLVAVAVGAVGQLRTGSYVTTMLPAFAVMGVGLGVASVASTGLGTEGSAPDQRGLASGLLNAAAQLGTVLGLAALVPLAADDSLAGYHAVFKWAGAAAAAGALLPLLTLRRRGQAVTGPGISGERRGTR